MNEKRVGEYQLLESIGSGQYGEVWKAVKGHLREEYAIKVINIRKIRADNKMKGFLEDEIKCLQLASGPNIVQFFEKIVDEKNYYLVFEYCREGTLEQLISRERCLSEERSLDIFDQLLGAFFELYRVIIIHRDVKPSNVLIKDNVIKLADFGFSKPLATEFDLSNTSVGSPIYMAPEVLQKRPYGRKVDIWSLGVVLYQMLHGECPYNGNSLEEILGKIQKRPPVLSASISPSTKLLLSQLLTVDPDQRISWERLFERLGKRKGTATQTPISFSYGSVNLPPTAGSAGFEAYSEPHLLPGDAKHKAPCSQNYLITPESFCKSHLTTPVYPRRFNTILNSDGVRQRTNPRNDIHQNINGQILRKPANVESIIKAEYQPMNDTANETGNFSKQTMQTTQTPVNENSSFNEMKTDYIRKLDSESVKHQPPLSQLAKTDFSHQQASRKNEKAAYGSSFMNNSNQTTLIKPTSFYGSFSGSNTPHNSHNKCISYLTANHRAAGLSVLHGIKAFDPFEKEFLAILKTSPFLSKLLDQLKLKSISSFPVDCLKRTVVANHQDAGKPFFTLISSRYCAKFIQERIRLFCSIRVADFHLQNHVVLKMMSQVRRYLTEAVKAVSMYDLDTLHENFRDHQEVYGRVKKEADEFDQIFSRFVIDLGAYLEQCDSCSDLKKALEWPNRFDEKQFKQLITKGVSQVLQTDECHRHRVANGLVDVLMMNEYVVKLVDFRERDKTFEDYNNRLTNEEQAVLVSAKLHVIE